MSVKPHILVIDDELKALEILAMRLRDSGFKVSTAATAIEGMKAAYAVNPDVILLDIVMPGIDGYEVCRRLRVMTDAVILFVSVKGRSEDVVRGLHMGADDYVVKPFAYQELLARITACLRRRSNTPMPPVRLDQGDALLVADPSRRLIFVDGSRSIQLTPKEFELLEYLLRNRGRVLSVDAILANVWGSEYKGDRHLVKQFIYRLRTKLEIDPSNPQYIVTIRGSGYAFEEKTAPIAERKQEKDA